MFVFNVDALKMKLVLQILIKHNIIIIFQMKLKNIPADGLAGLKQNFTKDAISGFLVFILALPLSLGIAKASDFPAIYGLVTAIIGGVIVSFFAGSRLTIKGPAAGLIAIAAGSVAAFGGGDLGWHLTLGAIMVAALVQILFGVLNLGKFADFFPSAAVHGMLAAIGIIIMAKQLHILLGISPADLKGKETLELFAMLPKSIYNEHIHFTVIGISCLMILTILSLIKKKIIRKIPAPIVVLMIAIPLGYYFQINHKEIEGKAANYALVKIGSLAETLDKGIVNVDFSGLASHPGVFWEYVMLFALIGTIESLLTAKAIDDLDPYQRKSNFNKDLTAVGVGNLLASLVGGLPMISEVARSSANVSNGAQTRWANFFHGLFLLLALLLAVPLIETIPNASLSAMLIFVGFKLAHPREFRHVFHIGTGQFFIFVATVIIILLTDLLIGVGCGIVLEIIMNCFNGLKFKDFFKTHFQTIQTNENQTDINVESSLVFSNVLSLNQFLISLQPKQNLNFDFRNCPLIDHTAKATLLKWKHAYELENQTKINFLGLDNHKKLGHSVSSALKKASNYN